VVVVSVVIISPSLVVKCEHTGVGVFIETSSARGAVVEGDVLDERHVLAGNVSEPNGKVLCTCNTGVRGGRVVDGLSFDVQRSLRDSSVCKGVSLKIGVADSRWAGGNVSALRTASGVVVGRVTRPEISESCLQSEGRGVVDSHGGCEAAEQNSVGDFHRSQ